MIIKKTDLTADVVSSYDQNKTTIQGRVNLKSIGGKNCYGPPLPTFYDVQNDFVGGLIPGVGICKTANGRLFSITAIAAGVATIVLYSLDAYGQETAVGKITIPFANSAATTHTIRGFGVVDTGSTGWKIFISTTGSVTINGGSYVVNKVDLADFTSLGTAFSFATSSDQKGVYFFQDPANIGAGQLNIAATGLIIDTANTNILIHNGVAATHQFYIYDYAAAPTWTAAAVDAITAATDIVTHTGHAFNNGDQVTFTSVTAGGLAAGTTYFVITSIPGVSYQLSATSGGAAINITSDGGGNIGRAFGITGSNFVHKTGNLPALTGTLILINSESQATPAHGTNSGQNCVFFPTSTNLYIGQISELTSGATTWPSLATSNILGSTNEITAPTITQAAWSNTLDCALYVTNVSHFVGKQLVNNVIRHKWGGSANGYYEAMAIPATLPIPFGLITHVGTSTHDGWLFLASSTAGQRGIFAFDLRSDAFYDYSYIVTKVLDTSNVRIYNFLSPLVKLQSDSRISLKIQYRTSGFGSITGGWVDLAALDDISAIAVTSQIQFKILWDLASNNSRNVSPLQLHDLLLGATLINENSENWVGSHPNTISTSPAKSAFRLVKAYTSSVPKLYFRAYDDANSLVASANTVDNPTLFEYSTNNGSSWIPLGTIPNTINTTELRYLWAADPGVKVRVSIGES